MCVCVLALNCGQIDELTKGLNSLGSDLADGVVKSIMKEMDADSSGSIDYDEFITATINLNMLDREEKMREAFKRFDIDNSGTITLDELMIGLQDQGRPGPGNGESPSSGHGVDLYIDALMWRRRLGEGGYRNSQGSRHRQLG